LLKSKVFIVALVVVVILALAVASSKEGSGIKVVGNIISVPIAPLQSVISFMSKKLPTYLITSRTSRSRRPRTRSCCAGSASLKRRTGNWNALRGRIKSSGRR